jgi:hypothetical protein
MMVAIPPSQQTFAFCIYSIEAEYSVFSGESVPDMPTLSQDFLIGPASNIGAPFKSRQN